MSLRPKIPRTSQHDIDAQRQLIAVQVKPRSAGKDRAVTLTKIDRLIAKIAVTILNANADHIIHCVLNSTDSVPTGEHITLSRPAGVGDSAEENPKLILLRGDGRRRSDSFEEIGMRTINRHDI